MNLRDIRTPEQLRRRYENLQKRWIVAFAVPYLVAASIIGWAIAGNNLPTEATAKLVIGGCILAFVGAGTGFYFIRCANTVAAELNGILFPGNEAL